VVFDRRCVNDEQCVDSVGYECLDARERDAKRLSLGLDTQYQFVKAWYATTVRKRPEGGEGVSLLDAHVSEQTSGSNLM
jgi:hypothetical protein